MRLNFNNLKQLLQKYHEIAGDNFKYRINNTEPLSDEEDHALSAGLQGVQISDLNAAAYFGMELVNEDGGKKVIPFFPLQRRNLLDQDVIENVYLCFGIYILVYLNLTLIFYYRLIISKFRFDK